LERSPARGFVQAIFEGGEIFAQRLEAGLWKDGREDGGNNQPSHAPQKSVALS
jgi:hypothetical protein